MNAAPYRQLVWKEYRSARAFWLSLVVLAVIAQGLALWLSTSDARGVFVVCNLALGAPVFFALGCAGAIFAVEREEGTFAFLEAAPVSSGQVFASKLALTAVATVAMFALLWVVALTITGGASPAAAALRGMLGLWLLAAVEAIAWGTLFSLLTARPLVAVCLALAITSTSAHLLAQSAAHRTGYVFSFGDYLRVWPWRSAIATIVLAADVYLGIRWLHGAGGIAPEATSKSPPMRVESPATTIAQVQPLALRPEPGVMFSRLVWQTIRQSGHMILLMAGLQIGLTAMVALGENLLGGALPLVPLAGMAAVGGSCAFLADQERRQVRFFVEHNVPPRYVWLSRQLPWIAVLFLSSLLSALLWLGPRSNGYMALGTLVALPGQARFPTIAPGFPDSAAWAMTLVGGAAFSAYAAGQWTSMMVRSGLLAGFFGLLLAGLLAGWAALTAFLMVPWWWSVWPIPLVLLGATWLRAPDWIRETATWKARSKAAAAVLVPVLALGIIVPNYEVYRVPWVSPGFDPQVYAAQLPADGRATADLYRRANDLFVPFSSSPDKARWLAQNTEPLQLMLEASARPNCLLSDPRRDDGAVSLSNGPRLISLLLTSARELERKGKLDEALDRHFAALRVLSHWSQDNATCWTQDWMEPERNYVFESLATWAARPGQTVERIRGAIERIAALDSSILHLDDNLQATYLVARRFATGDQAAGRALVDYWVDNPEFELQAIMTTLMPWEKYHEVRLLNQRTQDALEHLQQMRQLLRRGEGVISYLPASSARYFSLSEFRSWQLPSRALQQFGLLANEKLAQFEEYRRATLLLLALEAYRLEHGELPESLDALTGTYLDAVPHDPYSGLDFMYYPAGLPKPITPLEKAKLEEPYGPTVTPEVPCIWSTSAQLAVQFFRPRPDEETSKPAEIPYYVRRGTRGIEYQLPNYTAWRLGNWFPIPPRGD